MSIRAKCCSGTAVASLLDAARRMQHSFTLSTYRAASLRHAGIMVDPAWPHLADMQSLAELMYRRGELSAQGLKYVIAAVAAVVVKTASSPARLGVVTHHCGLSISVCPNADTTGYDVLQAWHKFSDSVLVLNCKTDVVAARKVSAESAAAISTCGHVQFCMHKPYIYENSMQTLSQPYKVNIHARTESLMQKY